MADLTYDRKSFFANLRAQGHNITPEQEEAFDKEFHNQSPNGDLFSIAANGLNSAVAFIQTLLKAIGFDISLDSIGKAMDDGQQRGALGGVDRYAHIMRNKALEIGIDPRTAAAMTGDTSTGVAVMSGNLRDVLLAQINLSPENLQRGGNMNPENNGFGTEPAPLNGQRFTVVDNPQVSSPTAPSAANQTHALTGYTPGA